MALQASFLVINDELVALASAEEPCAAAAAGSPSPSRPPPPIAVTLADAVTLAAYRRAVCVPTPVPPSNKLQKVILSIIIYRFEFFLRVEFARNYHAIWAPKSKLCNEIWAPS